MILRAIYSLFVQGDIRAIYAVLFMGNIRLIKYDASKIGVICFSEAY